MAPKSKENRTIVLPILEEGYSRFISDGPYARSVIEDQYGQYPELFPSGMDRFVLNGKSRRSRKSGYQLRKIRVEGQSYRIRPAFLLSYHRGCSVEASKGLLLLRFGVPFWALSHVLGHSQMWWYRLFVSLGEFNLVGTTVYQADQMPKDLLADEKHIIRRGKKAYIATTVGQDCILGSEAAALASQAHLEPAYAVFKQEARRLDPAYFPQSVNTDGWHATQNSWRELFPTIVIIECFLHAFLKIRDRATKALQDYFDAIADKVWNLYQAPNKRSLAQQTRRLREYLQEQVPESQMKKKGLKLCQKTYRWMAHLDHPHAHRTSNMLDRVMKFMNRHARNAQTLHGSLQATSKNFRAFALIYNFSPYSPQTQNKHQNKTSPVHKLNSRVYHQDWFYNLNIAASLGGNRHHRNPG